MTKKTKQKPVLNETEMTNHKTSQAGVVGTVVSSKMDKTLVVQIMRMVKHPLNGKYQRHYSKMYVHDAEAKGRNGDVVKIQQTRPYSKTKRWKLVEVLRRADRTLDAPEFDLEQGK